MSVNNHKTHSETQENEPRKKQRKRIIKNQDKYGR